MTRTLLLADDSDVIQGLIERGLAELDFELIASDNGDEAIEMARSVRPDIVLADVGLPGRDGYQVCRAIKENPELSGVPVVLLAGAFDPFDPAKAQASGADDHITKPFEANALVQRLDALLAPGPEAPHPSLASSLAHTEESETSAETPHLSQTPDGFVLADEVDLADEDDLIEALPLAEGHLESEGNSIGANGEEPSASFDDAFDFGSPSPESAPGDPESGYLGARGDQSFPAEAESRAQPPRSEHPAPGPVSDPEPLPDHLGEIRSLLDGTHEQIAKEAFAQLPEAVIQLLVERVEAIAWEVIPGMAESLIREEIRRMKAGDE